VVTERQQYIKDIASIYNQHGSMKNKRAMYLLKKEFPKYDTIEWGNDFRSAQQTAKKMGLIRNNGIKQLVTEHKRSSFGEWGT